MVIKLSDGANQTFPQVRFSESVEIIKLPVGLLYIVSREADDLKRAVQAAELTFADWYNSRFVLETVIEIARELSVSVTL